MDGTTISHKANILRYVPITTEDVSVASIGCITPTQEERIFASSQARGGRQATLYVYSIQA